MHFSNLHYIVACQLVGNCFWAQRDHHSINCTYHIFLILTAKFCKKCLISRISPEYQKCHEMFLDFIKVSSYVISKIQKTFLAKHQLSIFRLWIFGSNGPFKSVATTQKWTQKRCFPSFSEFCYPWFLDSLPSKTYLGAFIAKKDNF